MRLSGTVYSEVLEMDTDLTVITPNDLRDAPYQVVYLLHGLFVLWLRHRRPEMLRGMPAVLLVWAALLVLLGSPWVGKGVRFVCGGWYIQLRNSQIARRAGEKLVSGGC